MVSMLLVKNHFLKMLELQSFSNYQMDPELWPVLWNAWKGLIWCISNPSLTIEDLSNFMPKQVRFCDHYLAILDKINRKLTKNRPITVTWILATLPDDDEFKEAVNKLKEFTGLDVRIMTQGDGDDNLPWFPQACFQYFLVSHWSFLLNFRLADEKLIENL